MKAPATWMLIAVVVIGILAGASLYTVKEGEQTVLTQFGKPMAIEADAGSGDIVILGAAAHLIKAGDLVIIFSFGFFTPEEARKHKPKVLVLEENNKVKTP